jgi:flagellar hook protein FlgE
MGIYGALSNAVSGLRAQAFALENISGNIANSQTAGFKRIDTDFLDMIPDAPQTRQTAGSVLAQSRSTNSVQGDVKSVSTQTNMAINGNGFFVVEPRIGQADGSAVFAGANYYTRRGDFDLDKSGYLVNGAGYYLKGLPIDPETQNISGSVPQVLQVSNAFLPAAQTTRVSYQLNLPQLPKTAAYQASQVAGSELLNATNFTTVAPDTAATATGTTSVVGTDGADTIVGDAQTLRIQIGGVDRTYTFANGGGTTGTTIDFTDGGNATDTVQGMLDYIRADLVAQGATGASVAIVGGNIRVTAGNTTDSLTVTDGTAGTTGNGFGLASSATTYNPTISNALRLSSRANTIAAANSDLFVNQSISGGAITAYAENGASANVQMRWAKVNSVANGGADVWNLYVLTNASPTEMWTRVGGDYRFGSSGAPNPPIENTQLNGLTVNGVLIGNVTLAHGSKGLTQFADPNGTAEVTSLSQNGYAAGEFVSVAVSDNGRVVVSYNNGQQLEVAQVVTANFNAANQLKRMDGGVFAATSESGEPILDNDGGIIGASLEASNTDISEEFTKLIITQQAYAAGTRIVSTADQMLQEALNMVR